MTEPKPPGIDKFTMDKFTKALCVLATVPKEKADARVAANKRRRMRKRAQKK